MADPLLAHDLVTAPAAEPERWCFVLHGLFGAGRNWASVCRRVVRQRPDWGAVLVDLREHGGSRNLPPPHTLAAAGSDLERLGAGIGIRPAAVLGHSFGGKVALAYTALWPPGLRQTWVVDATPAARPPGGSAWAMFNLLRALPARFSSRTAAVEALRGQRVEAEVAEWLVTNLEPEPESGGYRWRFDLTALEALLESFFAADMWPVVESARAHGVDLHVVRATASDILDTEALARLAQLAGEGGVQLHEVAGGHWVNTENPGALEALLTEWLPAA